MQKARCQDIYVPPTACKRTVSGLFTLLFGVLFTFPSRYWFTIGFWGVFSLSRWCCQIQREFLQFPPTQDTRHYKLFTHTRLSLPMVGLSRTVLIKVYKLCKSYNPNFAETKLVWAMPRSLATTCGITFVFSSWGYLDVSVPLVRLPYGIPINRWVAPFGHLRINIP